ncbi:MAG: substrate-binding domain-containing protein [Actinobacteria bacterium]|nr:substrate-binding domain-containing protein [Actinomycetota bacterium]
MIYSPFFSALIRSIESIATQHDYSVIICESQYDVKLENKHLKTLIDRMVDGIIINPASRTYNNIKNIANQGVKIVILGHPEFFNINISSVYFDEYEGMLMAIQHLVDNGHKKILFVSGDIENPSENLRTKGYKDALKKNNISLKDELIIKTKVNIEGGYNISDTIFKSDLDFSAIMCFNDLVAMGILKYCHEKSIIIPNDYSLMGFDDIFCASLLKPSLTTVHQPKNYLGKIVGELLINKLNDININNQHIKIAPTLVIRESVRKINQV